MGFILRFLKFIAVKTIALYIICPKFYTHKKSPRLRAIVGCWLVFECFDGLGIAVFELHIHKINAVAQRIHSDIVALELTS